MKASVRSSHARPVTTSVTIASTTGDLTASVAYTNSAWLAPYTNQALKWGVDSGQGGGDIGPGTGTTTHAWTDQWALNAHAVSGANFKASTAADFTLIPEMEVDVDKASGAIRVRRVACAHDCGLVINPNALRAQIEGNILGPLIFRRTPESPDFRRPIGAALLVARALQ